VRREEPGVPAGPGEVRRLVDRSEVAGAVRPPPDVLRRGVAVVREPGRELTGERVQVLRVAVVEEVPDDLHSVPPAGFDEGPDRGEVVPAPVVHQGPAHAVSRRADADFPQKPVVFVNELVVAGRRHLVDPLFQAVVAGRALKAGEKEALEHYAALASGPAPAASRPTADAPPRTSSR
jgi:hypothetical protein